ncbi:hypothetical protein AZE42_13081 [Rhizopogon vesiculosus]|uniref:Uncharacterized protein n=1 Tax=Rhizopogon vesiculosus TaxID=180088 RepID=A0A1J8Q214_9AGAM|nr:hypothetical protein AZE42_13081 [Rhizopogon vesiculosus]
MQPRRGIGLRRNLRRQLLKTADWQEKMQTAVIR